jgi:hypothetical protein
MVLFCQSSATNIDKRTDKGQGVFSNAALV